MNSITSRLTRWHRLVASAALGVVVGAASPAMAQPPAPAVQTSTLGPQVGSPVPAFEGVDQFGVRQSLASLSGPNGLMLVFSRSVDW